jgi:calcineurin-like phosphoesterase family protein
MYFFTADWHLGHDKVIAYCSRPFGGVVEMAEALVRRHNEVVQPGDVVYMLGDTVWSKSAGDRYLPMLKGNIVHVSGGHDHRYFKQTNCPIVHFHPKGQPELYLCHYPLLSWPGLGHGVCHLHGHSHGMGPVRPNALDVGVDVWGFYPVPLTAIIEKLNIGGTHEEVRD